MSKEEEHERPEDMVESPGLAERAARSLGDAADSNATLEGYYSVNDEPKQAEEDIADELNQARRKDKSAGA